MTSGSLKSYVLSSNSLRTITETRRAILSELGPATTEHDTDADLLSCQARKGRKGRGICGWNGGEDFPTQKDTPKYPMSEHAGQEKVHADRLSCLSADCVTLGPWLARRLVWMHMHSHECAITPDRALVMSWYTNLSGFFTMRIASASP